MLDAGSGVGHWGRLIAGLVSPEASIVGIEREPRWVAEAERRAEPFGGRFRYQEGVAEALPFDEGTFDIEAFLSDKPAMMIPPYAGPEQQRRDRGGQVPQRRRGRPLPDRRSPPYYIGPRMSRGPEGERRLQRVMLPITCGCWSSPSPTTRSSCSTSPGTW